MRQKQQVNPLWFAVLLVFGLGVYTGVWLLEHPAVTAPVVGWIKGVSAEELSARALFDDAWSRAKSEYVDTSMNHQDWNRWKRHYQSSIHTPDDAYVAISSMLTSLNDDYTRFLTPTEMTEQHLQIDAQLYGVGIQIMVRDKQLTVVAPLADTPAEAAGVKPQDKIMAINGELTVGMSVRDAADRIRGKEGTQVVLTLSREGQKIDVTLKRAQITVKSVTTEPIKNHANIGYVRLSTFISERASDEMRAMLDSLSDKEALILDLRGNYGGLLQNALVISDYFLSKGTIVSVVGQRHGAIRHTKAHADANDVTQPLVVLIDGGSASASEILSGALQDNHRAVLIGDTSFGKGLVQKIVRLNGGAGMNITISKYLTPSGKDIHKIGIKPDKRVVFTDKDIFSDRDPQKEAAIEYLTQYLKNPTDKHLLFNRQTAMSQ